MTGSAPLAGAGRTLGSARSAERVRGKLSQQRRDSQGDQHGDRCRNAAGLAGEDCCALDSARPNTSQIHYQQFVTKEGEVMKRAAFIAAIVLSLYTTFAYAEGYLRIEANEVTTKS